MGGFEQYWPATPAPPDLWRCQDCGALVTYADQMKHSNWHMNIDAQMGDIVEIKSALVDWLTIQNLRLEDLVGHEIPVIRERMDAPSSPFVGQLYTTRDSHGYTTTYRWTGTLGAAVMSVCRWCHRDGYHTEVCEGFAINDPARTVAARTAEYVLTDWEMRKARMSVVFEVGCKACQEVLGHTANRGEAWLIFARHAAARHNDGPEEA